MSLATAPAPRRRPTLRCTRCGSAPRLILDDGTLLYLCGACVEPGRVEDRQAKAADPANPRLYLVVRLGWAGGWTR